MVTKCIIDEIPTEIYDYLDKIGVPSHVQGYDYAAYAVVLLLKDPGMLHRGITKELYPGVAEAVGSTSSRVERSIRHAIEITFDNGNYNELCDIFGYSISSSKGTPTVSQFLSTIMRKVRRDILDNQDNGEN